MKIYKYLITGITLIVLANKAAYGRFEPQYRIATAPSVVKNTAPSAIRICGADRARPVHRGWPDGARHPRQHRHVSAAGNHDGPDR